MGSPIAGLVRCLRGLEVAFPETARFVRFGIVGASGVLVDAAVTYLADQVTHPDVAFVIGIGTAMTWNFFWNRRITFADATSSPMWQQYLGFCASCSLGAVISFVTRTSLRRLVPLFATHIVLAVPVGVVAGMMFNYLLCRRWVFRGTDRDEASVSHGPNTPPH